MKISKRTKYSLILAAALVIIFASVYAFNSGGPPSTYGHTTGEIAPPSGCSAGYALKWDGSKFICDKLYSLESGPGGYLVKIISANEFDKSNLYETSTGRIGIGTTFPRSKLDVAGNIVVNGTICSSQGNCVGGGGSNLVITGDYYPTTSGTPKNIGAHNFCYPRKTDVEETSGGGCLVYKSGLDWYIQGLAGTSHCVALCVD